MADVGKYGAACPKKGSPGPNRQTDLQGGLVEASNGCKIDANRNHT
jgi:hypothetical protein